MCLYKNEIDGTLNKGPDFRFTKQTGESWANSDSLYAKRISQSMQVCFEQTGRRNSTTFD